MISTEMIIDVARTGQPAKLPMGWELTVNWLIRETNSFDWSGELIAGQWEANYCMLKDDAARRLTKQLNRDRPWEGLRGELEVASRRRQRRRRVAIEGAGRPVKTLSTVLDGVVVEAETS